MLREKIQPTLVVMPSTNARRHQGGSGLGDPKRWHFKAIGINTMGVIP